MKFSKSLLALSFLLSTQAFGESNSGIVPTFRLGADTYMGPKASVGLFGVQASKSGDHAYALGLGTSYSAGQDHDAFSVTTLAAYANNDLSLVFPGLSYTAYQNRHTREQGYSTALGISPIDNVFTYVGYQHSDETSKRPGIFAGFEVGY